MQSLDYGKYGFSVKEWFLLVGKSAGLFALAGYLFYDSWWIFTAFIPFVIGMYFYQRKAYMKLRLERLTEQFKDAIILLYSYVAAGSTLELAFHKAADGLLLNYTGRDDIVREFMEIRRKLRMNITIEDCVEDFARRTRQEDIQSFSEVIAIAKRGGGSMTAIIKNSVDTIKNKIDSEREIQTVISGKKNEFRLMVIVPAAVILYMRIFSAGFMDVLYGDVLGVVIMTVCLAVYLGTVAWGMRILNIRI